MINLNRMGSGRELLMKVFSLGTEKSKEWSKNQRDETLTSQKNTRSLQSKNNK